MDMDVLGFFLDRPAVSKENWMSALDLDEILKATFFFVFPVFSVYEQFLEALINENGFNDCIRDTNTSECIADQYCWHQE